MCVHITLQTRIEAGEDFYEALAKIAAEVRGLNIDLNPELVNMQIKKSQKIIDSEINQD